MAQALTVGEELRVLVLTRPERLDLLDLERQQVEVAVACTGATPELLDLRDHGEHLGVTGRELAASHAGRRARERIEQVELSRGEGELAVLVLAVEGDQACPELAQIRRRGR